LSFYIAKVVFINNDSADIVWLLTMRVSAITISSIMLISAVNFEELILYLMQHLRLPVIIGYPCLSAINALANFKQEYTRIKSAYLMRYGKVSYSLLIFYPMLISATRYALQNGLSMEARGLNKTKTFIHRTSSLKLIDLVVIVFNIIILLEIKDAWHFVIINMRYLCQI
ncbi:MAG: energy-coupling factor transporter transmembrane protein EcfT, partial [Burkholderiales bacterium]|nr:energy-coupling factor transporter transmembrane protein EcfT [Burkholderiales bacterium]